MVELLFLIGTLSSEIERCALDPATSMCATGSLGDGGVTLDALITSSGIGSGDDSTSDIGIDGGAGGDDPNTVCENRAGQSYCWSVTPPVEAGTSPVTLADIAHFRPDIGAHTMQPNGWAVVGLPANFVSAASVHTIEGILLGSPASVRFTPASWYWGYGDGVSATLPSGGLTWSQSGSREFGATPTSHVFQRKGTHTVTLAVDLRAEYRVGSGPWVPIAGTLRVEASPLAVTATGAQTVLVDRDCARYAIGAGCR